LAAWDPFFLILADLEASLKMNRFSGWFWTQKSCGAGVKECTIQACKQLYSRWLIVESMTEDY